MNEDVQKYIGQMRKMGNSDEQIKESLRNSGWEEEQIKEFFPSSGNPSNSVVPTPKPQEAPAEKIGKFKASGMIVDGSWKLLKQDKEIMVFPVLSSITSIVFIIVLSVLFFVFVAGGSMEALNAYSEQPSSAIDYAFLFLLYFVNAFIVVFFQAGIIAITNARVNGKDFTFKDGFRVAVSHIKEIFIWSLLSASVGVVLRAIFDRSKWLGKIVVSMLGAVWGIATFFIVPIIVVEDLSIKNSIQKSVLTIKKTWGESLIVNIGLGFYFALLAMLGFLAIGISLFTKSALVIVSVVVLAIIYFLLLAIVYSTLNTIFRYVLYEYADKGIVPEGFSAALLNQAFRQSKKAK